MDEMHTHGSRGKVYFQHQWPRNNLQSSLSSLLKRQIKLSSKAVYQRIINDFMENEYSRCNYYHYVLNNKMLRKGIYFVEEADSERYFKLYGIVT